MDLSPYVDLRAGCFVGTSSCGRSPRRCTPADAVTNDDFLGDHVGALIAAAASAIRWPSGLGHRGGAASVNIFGGFAVTARMLAMYKKKERVRLYLPIETPRLSIAADAAHDVKRGGAAYLVRACASS